MKAKKLELSDAHIHQQLVKDHPGAVCALPGTLVSPSACTKETQRIVLQDRGQVLAVGSEAIRHSTLSTTRGIRIESIWLQTQIYLFLENCDNCFQSQFPPL